MIVRSPYRRQIIAHVTCRSLSLSSNLLSGDQQHDENNLMNVSSRLAPSERNVANPDYHEPVYNNFALCLIKFIELLQREGNVYKIRVLSNISRSVFFHGRFHFQFFQFARFIEHNIFLYRYESIEQVSVHCRLWQSLARRKAINFQVKSILLWCRFDLCSHDITRLRSKSQ